MRKKSNSSVEIENADARVRSRNLHPLISPPNFEEKRFLFNNSQMISGQKSNLALVNKELSRLKNHKAKSSLNLKNNEEKRVTEDISKEEKMNFVIENLDDCRRVLDKIIAKNKSYGQVLKCVKDVYEKHLDKQYQQLGFEKEINLKEKIMKKCEENKCIVKSKKRMEKSISNSILIRTKPLKLQLKSIKNKDSVSTLDTNLTSPRNIVPELSVEAIPRSDFHDEFMANYENFSESWRNLSKQIRK